jgi:hypothetical protein
VKPGTKLPRLSVKVTLPRSFGPDDDVVLARLSAVELTAQADQARAA